MDCEMVGVGPDGSESALGRISLVNFFGHTIYDRYVRPIESVTDYRTEVSGITPELLEDAPDFASVQREVASLLKSRVVVGHDLDNDFKVLMFGHPQESRRDTSKYPPLVKLGEGKRPSLKQLAATLLNLKIQTKAHSSVQDAQVAMLLYRKFKVKWDSVLLRKNKPGTENKSQVKV
ncbi:ribonuclease H-like domain-containing protein [Dimargaris cristalligena]|uniref:RNA exonuclease 4 n=1 Tax=Dimargaris cristalligena TaxID=215637 RepID=A0A4P9ZLD5_9FUNG|nr:ribonuclease H-like domain-containing protein [Dimargaris cristalligena]|eukprot:RKP34087.1 ribonuclease H-like domain-containing protein [Dimargaris cristalligena]